MAADSAPANPCTLTCQRPPHGAAALQRRTSCRPPDTNISNAAIALVRDHSPVAPPLSPGGAITEKLVREELFDLQGRLRN